MPISKNQISLLSVFYKSTLPISISFSALCAALNMFDILSVLFAFGVCFLSGGTILSLLYKEISKQKEYYFFYNKGLSKIQLMVTCVVGNFIVGASLVIIAIYAKHLRN